MTWRRFAPKVTKAEHLLFHALNKAGIRFFSQEYLKTKHRDYLVDFLVFPNIIVEVDGASHDTTLRQMKDEIKDQHLHEQGYTVLRFKDYEVFKNTEKVVKHIRDVREKCLNKKSALTVEKAEKCH